MGSDPTAECFFLAFDGFLMCLSLPAPHPPTRPRAYARVTPLTLDRVRFTVLDFRVYASQLGVDDVGGGLPQEPPDDRRGNVRHGF